MRVLLIGVTILLGACDYNLGNPLPCETRFAGIENPDRPFSDDIFVYDTIYSYDITGFDKAIVDELIERNEGSTLSFDGSKTLLNITKPEVAREDAVELGCADEVDGASLTAITFAKATERPDD